MLCVGRPTGVPWRFRWAFASSRLDTTLRAPSRVVRRRQVVGSDRIAGWVGGDAVGSAEADVSGDPAADQHRGIRPRPVVPGRQRSGPGRGGGQHAVALQLAEGNSRTGGSARRAATSMSSSSLMMLSETCSMETFGSSF